MAIKTRSHTRLKQAGKGPVYSARTVRPGPDGVILSRSYQTAIGLRMFADRGSSLNHCAEQFRAGIVKSRPNPVQALVDQAWLRLSPTMESV